MLTDLDDLRRAPPDSELAGVEAFVREVEALYATGPVPPPPPALARVLAGGLEDPAPAPATELPPATGGRPAPALVRWRGRVRRAAGIAVAPLAALGLWGKAAVAGAVVAASVGGLGAAGKLPAVVQTPVRAVAAKVGLHFPTPAGTRPVTSRPPATTGSPGTTPATQAGGTTASTGEPSPGETPAGAPANDTPTTAAPDPTPTTAAPDPTPTTAAPDTTPTTAAPDPTPPADDHGDGVP